VHRIGGFADAAVWALEPGMIETVLLALVVLMLSLGQLLFKHVGATISGTSLTKAVWKIMTLPSFYGSLIIYGVATLLWIYVLSRVPLSVAYPWMAAAMLIVPFLSWLVFDDEVGPLFWPGCALIVVGLILTQLGRAG
jgi:multidrug transporter EmrE-like cation transporter